MVTRKSLVEQADDLAETIKAREAELDAIAERAREVLSADATYVLARDEVAKAIKTFQRARDKAKVAEEDRVTKGKAYESDPLFMYLWKRAYKSRDYKANTIVRYLDSKVADLVGYHDARANYSVLLDIPKKLREHANLLATRVKETQTTIADIEATKVRELAGEDLPAKLEAVRKEKMRVNKALGSVGAEITEADGQLNNYLEGRDDTFRRAIEISATLLQQDSLSRLRYLARKTESPTDDQIVARIRHLDGKIEDMGKSGDKQRKRLDELFERREELMRISADFRRNHYDDPGSIFVPGRGGSNAEDLLGQLLRAAITGAEFWARMQSRHRWRRRPADSYRRSRRIPPWGGMLGGGGWTWSSGGSWSGSRRRDRDYDDDDFDFDFDFDDDRDEPEFRSGGGF